MESIAVAIETPRSTTTTAGLDHHVTSVGDANITNITNITTPMHISSSLKGAVTNITVNSTAISTLIDDRLEELDVIPVIDNIIQGFRREIRHNIFSDDMPNMLASCLDKQPSGNEKGICLAVDLGGSTFRVALVHLHGVSNAPGPVEEILIQQVYKVDDHVKSSVGHEFFNWMVDRVEMTLNMARKECTGQLTQDFLALNTDFTLPMGLSWSFPFEQTKIYSGSIQSMGKGYNVAEHVRNWDLKESFERVFSQRGLKICVHAIVNDGAASFISNAYLHPSETKMALILGTGLNAAVMTNFEFLDTQNRLKNLTFSPGATSCLVNTEASMLGTMPGVLPETSWDKEVDSMNEIPGFQPLETKCSGRYLGEISRRIIREFVQDDLITLPSNVKLSGFLPDAYCIDGKLLSDMEESYSKHEIAELKKLFVTEFPACASISEDSVVSICQVFIKVSSRACALTAACLIALASEMLTKDQASNCCIAYTGTVIEKYYGFVERTEQYLHQLGRPRGMKLRLQNSVDGSIYGPAIAASMYAK